MVLRTAVIEAVAVLPRRHGAFVARRVVAGWHGRDVQAGAAIVSVDAFKVVRWPAQLDADARAEEDAVLNLIVWAVEGQPDVAPLVAERLAALRVRAAAPVAAHSNDQHVNDRWLSGSAEAKRTA